MRQLHELLASSDPAWPLIQGWIAASGRSIEAAPSRRVDGEATLLALQVSTHSTLGAVALETGGVFVDHGWLRFLGSGGSRMRGSLLSWNGLGIADESPAVDNALVVAHDAIGGFFALNGGAWTNGEAGEAFYFAPDTLQWESLHFGYTDLLRWALLGDLDGFYRKQRWPDWQQDTDALDGDHGIFIWPPLFAKEPPISVRTKRIAPQRELWDFQLDVARQTKDLPNGASIQLHIKDE